MFEFYERVSQIKRELRKEDAHGRRSDSTLEEEARKLAATEMFQARLNYVEDGSVKECLRALAYFVGLERV